MRLNMIQLPNPSRYVRVFLLLLSPLFLNAQVEIVGSDKLELEVEDEILKIPFFSNHPIHIDNEEVRYAVVVIHGTNRN